MILFHGSFKQFEINKIIKANELTPYFLSKQAQGSEWIDLVLNDYKPDHAPLRQYTLYACDSVANASAFIENQKMGDAVPIYYKVEMVNPVKGVMCLTDLLFKNGPGHELNPEISQEYWSSSQDWRYHEYLSNEMKILEVMPAPNFMEKTAGRNSYMADFELRKKLYDDK